jgi:hypothetical protein
VVVLAGVVVFAGAGGGGGGGGGAERHIAAALPGSRSDAATRVAIAAVVRPLRDREGRGRGSSLEVAQRSLRTPATRYLKTPLPLIRATSSVGTSGYTSPLCGWASRVASSTLPS